MTTRRVTQALSELGFTGSEAKVYLELLRRQPATGYEVAARSGVPRSAIYTLLRRLEEAGLVNAIQERPARYVPLAPERLYELLEARFQRSLKELRESMAGVIGPAEAPPTWHVQGYPALLENAVALVGRAERSVFCSLWRREADELAEALGRSAKRGVKVVLFSFTALPEIGRVLSYGLDQAELERHWRHKLLLVADERVALVGSAEPGEGSGAVLTEEPAVVEMALSNLVLDITLYGQRVGVDTSDVVRGLTRDLAPIDELLRARRR